MRRVPRQVLVYLCRRTGEGTVEFLLLRRVPENGGFWQGVTGAPEWGETDEQAAVREVLEETGFHVGGTIEALDCRYHLRRETGDPAQWDRLYGTEVTEVPEETYVAQVSGSTDPVLAPAEHDTFVWCGLEEALRLLEWEENREALLIAHAHAGTR